MCASLVDNVGHAVPPGVESGHPVLASGVTLTDAATGGNHTEALLAGHTYKIMADATGGWLFGIADVTTAANVLWFVPPSKTVCLTLPLAYATLNYECLVNGGKCYIVEME